MTSDGSVQAPFRRSSFCAASECVEIAQRNGVITLRDSSQPQGNTLNCPPKDWQSFVRRIKAGRLDALGSLCAPSEPWSYLRVGALWGWPAGRPAGAADPNTAGDRTRRMRASWPFGRCARGRQGSLPCR